VDVAGNPISTSFLASATGDLDEDAAIAIWTIDKSVAAYPKAVNTGFLPPGQKGHLVYEV